MKEIKEETLKKLSAPMPVKWRVQSIRNGNAICVAYIDARQVSERFDSVVGVGGWQNTYDPETGASSIAVYVNGDWVWKSDVGTESNVEKEKGKASDALKRSAVLFGVGRFIYELGTKVLKSQGKYPVTSKGDVLYTGDQLTQYLNQMSTSKGLLLQIHKLNPQLQENERFNTLMKELYGMV